MDPSLRAPEAAPARIGLWDAVSIIVGIIIGVGIFETPTNIFTLAPGPWEALGVWVIGGFLALAGAMCFAELASAYPRSGGEYVYLTRAFGPLVGYFFAWAQLTVIRPGGIAALACVFANHASKTWNLSDSGVLALSLGVVAGLTVINLLGVTLGKHTQNFLTILKVVGLIVIIVVGFWWGDFHHLSAMRDQPKTGWFATSMILVLWTYAGWHEAAYIAAEVRDSARNIPRALLLGTVAVMGIYLLVNLAYLLGLGFEGARHPAISDDLLRLAWPGGGNTTIGVLIMISALGAINGMIFTTARIYAEFGADHRLFRPLSRWSKRWGTPVKALLTQGTISLAMIGVVALWSGIGAAAKDLETMIAITAAVFWGFFFLTGVALFVLGAKDPDLKRPYRVPLYPLLPLVFCAFCGYMVYGAIEYKRKESALGLVILLAGLPFYFVPQKLRPVPAPPSSLPPQDSSN